MSHHYLLTQNSQSQRRVCIKKEERQKRVDERRVAEAAEQEKEPKGSGQSFWSWRQWRRADSTYRSYHADWELPMVDGDAQTSRTETTDMNTWASLVPTTPTTPVVYCLPAKYRVASKAIWPCISSEPLHWRTMMKSPNFIPGCCHGRC